MRIAHPKAAVERTAKRECNGSVVSIPLAMRTRIGWDSASVPLHGAPARDYLVPIGATASNGTRLPRQGSGSRGTPLAGFGAAPHVSGAGGSAPV